MVRALLNACAVPLSTIFWISYSDGFPGICSVYSLVPFLIRPRAPIAQSALAVLSGERQHKYATLGRSKNTFSDNLDMEKS